MIVLGNSIDLFDPSSTRRAKSSRQTKKPAVRTVSRSTQEAARRVARRELVTMASEITDPKVVDAAFDSVKTTPSEAHELIKQVADLLGLDEDSDLATVEQALETLFGLVKGDQADQSQAARALTAGQLKAAKKLGADPRDVVRVKRALGWK